MSLSSLSLAETTLFLGYCALLNIAILAASTAAIVFFKKKVIGFYSRILRLDANQVSELFFRFIVQYEVAVLVLNIVPYIALKIIY